MKECYGIKAQEIARRCGVDVATARRWKRGARRMPKTAAMILAADLGCFDPAWSGWTLRGGKLISKEGWETSPGDVLSIQLTQAQLSAYRDENRRLKVALADATLQTFDDQPLPDTAPAIVTPARLRT